MFTVHVLTRIACKSGPKKVAVEGIIRLIKVEEGGGFTSLYTTRLLQYIGEHERKVYYSLD